MIDVTKDQLIDVFWQIVDLVGEVQPELKMVMKKENIDMSGFTMQTITDMVDMLRFNIKYIMFDLEACRRDVSRLLEIINSHDANDGPQEIQH